MWLDLPLIRDQGLTVMLRYHAKEWSDEVATAVSAWRDLPRLLEQQRWALRSHVGTRMPSLKHTRQAV